MAVSSNRWVVALGLVIGCGEPRWERVAAMQHPRAAHAVVATQDTIVALAGIDGAGAPVLAVEASDDSLGVWWKGRYTLAEYHERLKSVPNLRIGRIEDAGHMLHHDQPEALARMLEGFLDE